MLRRVALVLSLVLAASAFAREVARVPATVKGNRVLLDVAVNEHPPSAFILDTGAARTVVEKEYAAKSGIRATGEAQAMGAAATVRIGIASDLVFRVGDIRMPASRVPLIPLGPINLRAGAPISGVLGKDVFSAYVVEMDYQRGTVAFHDRGSFAAPEGAVSVPLHFVHGSIPQIDVRITLPDGRTLPARLHVDTGAGPGVILTRAFVNEHKVELPGAIDTAVGLGVGGATTERTGRIAKIDVGGVTIERPIANLSNATTGVLGDSELDGLLGGEILRRFTVYFDYGRNRMHLVKNTAFSEPLDFDMLGATLASRDDSFRAIVVQALLAKSPASEAGLREGDEVRAIDGRAVTPKELDSIRALFRKPAQRYELTIVRDGRELQIPVTTRRLV